MLIFAFNIVQMQCTSMMLSAILDRYQYDAF